MLERTRSIRVRSSIEEDLDMATRKSTSTEKNTGKSAAPAAPAARARRTVKARTKPAAAGVTESSYPKDEALPEPIYTAGRPEDLNDSFANLAEAVSNEPLNREEVASLAYQYWEARGGLGGSHEEDWYRAEQELRSRKSAVGPA
jgi:hypothetical protein